MKDDVIVLRALEEDQAEEELYQEEEGAVAEDGDVEIVQVLSKDKGGKAKSVNSNSQDGGSQHQPDTDSDGSATPPSQARLPISPDSDSEKPGVVSSAPIVIDDDEDGAPHTSSELIEQEPLVFQDMKNAAMADPAAEDSEDDEQSEDDYGMTYPAPPSTSAQLNSLGLMSRIEALPDQARALAWSSNDQICEACQVPTTMRQWTHFGPKHGALCADCTKIWLEYNHDLEALAIVERMVEDEYVKKRIAEEEGHAQDLNENVAFNHPGGADEGSSDFFVTDPLQADAMRDYNDEFMFNQDEALFNEYLRNSSSRSHSPAMFEDASEEFADSNEAMAGNNDQPGPDFEVFLAEDDEDLLAAQMNNDQAISQHAHVQVAASPEGGTEDADGFDPEDWTTPLKLTKKRKRAEHDDDGDYDAGVESDGEDD